MKRRIPEQVRADLDKAQRLAWWTLFWMSTVVLAMWLAMGSSQAMKTALIEDLLSLIPAAVFLIALRFERKTANAAFPFGYDRVQSLASLIAAVALCGVGGLLIFDSVASLVLGKRPAMLPVEILGHQVWQRWLMIGGLLYSVAPPVILGHLKEPLARRLRDEVLDTDAMMQKADWMTGLAGVLGVLGVGLGFWWADAAAAAFISFSILKDGITSLRVATAELVDGTPRRLGGTELARDAVALRKALQERYPAAEIRLRATGRYIHAEVCGALPAFPPDFADVWQGDPEHAWRLAQISFVPGPEIERCASQADVSSESG
jgi:cobalt-zinc-cadmium efflux system protein